MAAALAAGADAVRVGTRFVASEEAEAHPFYVGALIDARAHDTIYTEAYSVSWSDAPHRVLRSGVEAAMAFSDEVVGTGFNIYTGQTYQLRRFERGTPHRGMTGAIEAMSLFAGESVAGVKTVQPAAEIVRELAGEAERLLRRWSD